MKPTPSRRLAPIRQLIEIMAALRSPEGCPWDREQDHRSLRWHAVEEVYELLDAIETGDDGELAEELGDLLLQVVFHAQLAQERGAFDFDEICRQIVGKLIRRHPHVFGDVEVKNTGQVWANWERIKRAEKAGSRQERKSALDGIPSRLPSLMRAQKLVKKAGQAGLLPKKARRTKGLTRTEAARNFFELASECQERGWSAESLLRTEIRRRETAYRKSEQAAQRSASR